MASVNLRQLRNTRQLKEWLAAGETVELRERDRVLAKIVPETAATHPKQLPDFEARLKEIWGDRVLPAVDTLWRIGRIVALDRLYGYELPCASLRSRPALARRA